jgi:hypothetical protein
MKWLVIVAALLVAPRAAEACKHAGKVLLKVTQSPVVGSEDSVPDGQLVIYASGAWGWVQEMPDGEEPASTGGCLSKKQLAGLKKAITRATFADARPEMCDAVTTTQIEYAAPGRKKKVVVTQPCGMPADAKTQAMIDRVNALTRR